MTLETEIKAFETMKEELERHYRGKFVIFHGTEFVGAFDTFNSAAAEAVRRFGHGPYLIRQVGVTTPPISASLAARLGISA